MLASVLEANVNKNIFGLEIKVGKEMKSEVYIHEENISESHSI